MSGVLGSASSYSAHVTWRAQPGTPYGAGELPNVSAVAWERTLNSTSTATVAFTLPAEYPACAPWIARMSSWCHELGIHRDGELIWQGPITTISGTGSHVTVTASDVTAWLDQLVNLYPLVGADATVVAADLITRALTDPTWSKPPDWPNILPHLVREDCGSVVNATDYPVVKYLSDVISDLASRGFERTAVGRALYLRRLRTTRDRAQASLTDSDFTGEVTVTEAGLAAGTVGVATTSSEQDSAHREEGEEPKGITVVAGTPGTPYGRLDRLVQVRDEAATPESLRGQALAAIGARYPAPVTISLPDGARLAPTAPVTLEQLVPGERLDVTVTSGWRPVMQGFRLTKVSGEWTPDGGEAVGISCSALTISALERP